MRMKMQRLKDGTDEIDVKIMDDGRTLIHWLRECEDGKIVVEKHPQLITAPWYKGKDAVTKYTLVCRPEQTTVSSQKRGNVRYMCVVSGDIDAVTCPACLATQEAKIALVVPRTEEEKAHQLQMDTIRSL